MAAKSKCESEIEKFCSNTKFGEARIQKCLYDSRRKDGFGDDCKAEIQSKITNAASDYRLDWKVKTKCLSDITAICPEEKKVADSSFFESGVVISCMKKSLGKIKDKTCRNEIVRVAGVQAEHISANKPAMNACSADITRFCPTVKKGEGKLQSCLRSHLQQLSDPCRAQEFKDMVVESADIEMKPKMARICKPSIKKFCTDMTHGDARIFDCLSEHKDDEDMDAACAEEIQADEVSMVEMGANSHFYLKHSLALAPGPSQPVPRPSSLALVSQLVPRPSSLALVPRSSPQRTGV